MVEEKRVPFEGQHTGFDPVDDKIQAALAEMASSGGLIPPEMAPDARDALNDMEEKLVVLEERGRTEKRAFFFDLGIDISSVATILAVLGLELNAYFQFIALRPNFSWLHTAIVMAELLSTASSILAIYRGAFALPQIRQEQAELAQQTVNLQALLPEQQESLF